MLQAIDICCHRDQRVLFESFSFTILPGEIVHLEGPNGAGKTTLLRMLTGLSRPEQGSIHWRQQPLYRQRDEWHRNLLYLAHQPGIKTVLTAFENLHFYHPRASKNAIYHALEAVELTGYEDLPVANFSAGQQRRVALARLWLTEAKVWILDEPLTAIDKIGVDTLMTRFVQHTAQGGMIILTTHQDLPDYCDGIKTLTLGTAAGEC